MYLPTSEVLGILANKLTKSIAGRITWLMFAQWDIDRIIINLDKVWPSNYHEHECD